MQARVVNPWYDRGGRKYLDLEVQDKILNVKVPFRYGRVLGCHVEGIRPVQEITAGEVVNVTLEKKMWEGQTHWVLKSIRT